MPSVIIVFSPQRWGSSLLQVSNSCTHGFYPLSCILSSQVLIRTKVRILQLKRQIFDWHPQMACFHYCHLWLPLTLIKEYVISDMSNFNLRTSRNTMVWHLILTRKKYDVWRWGPKSKHSSMKSSTKSQSGFYGQKLQNGVKTLLPISIIWSPEPGWMPNFECNLFESFARSCCLFFQQPC